MTDVYTTELVALGANLAQMAVKVRPLPCQLRFEQ